MPYAIREGGQDCPFEVYNEATGERVACHPSHEKATAHMRALYANVPDATESRNLSIPVVETRSAAVDDVDYGQRIITILSVPYESPTLVPFRGQPWSEVFSRTAFQGLDTCINAGRRSIPATASLNVPNINHEGGRLCGRVLSAYPDRPDGLVTDVKISRTNIGDETLELARDGALFASVGFMVREPHRDERLDRINKVRRVDRAFLDHLAFVAQPAYEGTKVLAMRGQADMQQMTEPTFDEYASDPLWRWAHERVEGRANQKP